MPDKKPTHEQAQLQLQLYDLRRESELRQARDWFNQSFFADSFEDCMTSEGCSSSANGPESVSAASRYSRVAGDCLGQSYAPL